MSPTGYRERAEMTRERLYLYDTTLRDGAQTNGVDFSLARQASPSPACSTNSASTMWRAAIRAPIRSTPSCSGRSANSKTAFAAFGMTKRAGRSAANDPGLTGLIAAKADAICFVAKSWDYHVRVALERTLEENLALHSRIVHRAKGRVAKRCSTASISSTATRLIRNSRSPARKGVIRPARDGWCCATPTAARCRMKSSGSSAR